MIINTPRTYISHIEYENDLDDPGYLYYQNDSDDPADSDYQTDLDDAADSDYESVTHRILTLF